MKVAVLMIVLSNLMLGAAHAQEPVHFSDAVLKAAVEEELWVLDPMPSDMLGLTSLTCTRTPDTKAIESLTGLEYATNLQTLVLTHHRIASVSALSGLTNLQTLRLDKNQVSSISALSELVNLQTLSLQENNITSVSALSGLSGLTSLNLHRNQISNISALSELTSLAFLDLRLNPLNSDAYDIYIPLIKQNNPGVLLLHDPDIVFRLMISSTVGGSVTEPGEGEFTFRYKEPVLIRAEADVGFVFSEWLGENLGAADSVFLVVAATAEIRASFLCLSDTIYVDDDAANDPQQGDADVSDWQEDGTAEHPFDRIQEAIDVAAAGASILVSPGTYRENLDFLGKRIRLLAIDSGEGTGAVIDGAGTGPVVRFTGGEDLNDMLIGFTLTGGQGDLAGAVYCRGSRPTIAHCLIVGNRATDPNGAAIYCVNSDAVFVNCTVADNKGGGIAMVDSNVTLLNSIVWGNRPPEIRSAGDGTPLVAYTDVAGGWPGPGNIDTDPLFARRGCWAHPHDPDGATELDESEVLWISGDYHLQSGTGRWNANTQTWERDQRTSPCVDGGDPDTLVGEEPEPNGARINMGAYGGTTEASKSS